MDRTRALTNLENWYCNLTHPSYREAYKAEIRRIYIESYAEELIRHLEQVSKERVPQ